MPRFARLVVPAYPHHVTQSASRHWPTFFCDADVQRANGGLPDPTLQLADVALEVLVDMVVNIIVPTLVRGHATSVTRVVSRNLEARLDSAGVIGQRDAVDDRSQGCQDEDHGPPLTTWGRMN